MWSLVPPALFCISPLYLLHTAIEVGILLLGEGVRLLLMLPFHPSIFSGPHLSTHLSLISTMLCLFRRQQNAKRRNFLLLLTCIDIFCRFQVRMFVVFISCTSLLIFWSLMFFLLVLFLSLSFRGSPPFCTNAHLLHLLPSKSLSHWRLLVKFIHFKWTYPPLPHQTLS